jgi:hypothetical protein
MIDISLVSHAALPDHEYPPTEANQLVRCYPVSSDVALKLFPPELLIRAGIACILAAGMSVPEAPVDEDDSAISR